MKKTYQLPQIEVVCFGEDIVRTSSTEDMGYWIMDWDTGV